MKHFKNVKESKGGLSLVYFVSVILSFFIISGCSMATYDNLEMDMYRDFHRRGAKKYFMKQKIWTVGDKFVIKDEYRNPVFFVRGKIFTIGDKLKFFDMDGNELAYIKEKVLSLKNLYKIYQNHRLTAKVKKKITLLKDKFVVNMINQDDFIIRGNFFDYRYTFFRNGRPVAIVSKKLMSFSDNYRVEIVPGEVDVVILAVTVIIDLINHDNKHHSHIFQRLGH